MHAILSGLQITNKQLEAKVVIGNYLPNFRTAELICKLYFALF